MAPVVHKQYSEEFRADAVALYRSDPEHTYAQAGRDLGVICDLGPGTRGGACRFLGRTQVTVEDLVLGLGDALELDGGDRAGDRLLVGGGAVQVERVGEQRSECA